MNATYSLEVLLYCMYCSVFTQFEIEDWLGCLVSIKESYTIREFLNLTDGMYGHDFFKSQFNEV